MTDKNGQLNVFMPQQSYTDRNGKKVYKDIAHPITEEARNIICGTILKQYQAHMQREAAEKTAGNTAQQQAQTAQLQPKLGQNYNYQSWDSLVNNPPPEPEPELEMG